MCFNGGAFSAVLDITLCVAGVTTLYVVLYTCFVSRGILSASQVGPQHLPTYLPACVLPCPTAAPSELHWQQRDLGGRCGAGADADGGLRLRRELRGALHAAGRRHLHQGRRRR